MSKPTFDVNSEAYLQYQWIVSVIAPYSDGLSIDTTDEDSEDEVETTTTITLTKKNFGKSYVTMKTDSQEITINWDGNRLSASVFDEETQDSDKMEVPDAITAIVDTLKDLFGIEREELITVTEETIDEDTDIDDDLSKDPEDDKPIEEDVEDDDEDIDDERNNEG